MGKNSKQTSKKVATTASKILRDGRYGKAAKSVAGSALAQAKSRGNKQFPHTRQAVTGLIINLPVSRKGANVIYVRFLIDKSNMCSYNKSIATLGKC